MNEKRRPIITKRVDKTNLKISVWPSQHGYQLSLQNGWKKQDSDEWTNVTISVFPSQARAFAEQILAVCDELHAREEENKKQAAKQEQRNQEPLPGFDDGDQDEIPFG